MSNIPRGYKLTEVGVIPENWEVKTVSEAFQICNNLRLPISQKVREKMTGLYPYYGPTNIQGYINEYRVEGEYALIGEDGDHFLKWREASMTLLVNGKFNVNNHAHLIKGVDNITSWFYYYFAHKDVTRYLTRQGAGRYKLTKRSLAKIPCVLPPTKAEQTAIAAALSNTDALIQSMEKLIAKKQFIKQGAMQELLKPKEGWVVKKLGEVAEIIMGQSPRSEYYNLNGIGLPLIQGNADVENRKTIKKVFTSDITKRGKCGDIIMSVRAPVGEISTAMFDCCLGRGVCAIRYQNDYLYYYLIYFEKSWSKLSTGSTFDSVNSQQIKSLEIPIPPLSEQTRIATILSDMDDEISALETKLAKYKQVKQGMMQELLTGGIRLV
ncbi:MAG: restriction endonuclease subunit S [Deltaproteobacteria bacterium]|nr:restriction endonuclease subunit S [Deltaproteobacteria bacterium]